jgi:hypothetical protein
VANPAFLLMLERLGSECADLQFLRELTVNGLDAIAALPHAAGSRVVWDLGWRKPLVTCAIGTASTGRSGATARATVRGRRLRRLTPVAARLIRTLNR